MKCLFGCLVISEQLQLIVRHSGSRRSEMMQNRSPLPLLYGCGTAESDTNAAIVEIAIRSLLFTKKVFYSFIFTNEKLS